MPIADSEAHISKKRRVDDTELQQPQFNEAMGGEACLPNDYVPYQGSPPPQIRVSPAFSPTFSPEPQSCVAFMAQLNIEGNLPLPALSVHDAARIPAPAPDPTPPTRTFTFDSGMSDTLISDSPGPWEADWTLFRS